MRWIFRHGLHGFTRLWGVGDFAVVIGRIGRGVWHEWCAFDAVAAFLVESAANEGFVRESRDGCAARGRGGVRARPLHPRLDEAGGAKRCASN